MKESLTIEEATQTLRALKDLIASEGWKIYIDVVREQQAVRAQEAMTAVATRDETYNREYSKGAFAGLTAAAGIPEHMIDDLTEQLENNQNDPE